MRTGILSLALALCGCADEWEDEYGDCHEEGDCFFSRAEWEEIRTLAMVEEPTYEFGLAEAVGETIFFDEGLGPHGVSCATCHPPEGWFTAPIKRREADSDDFRGITTVIDVTSYEWHKWDGSKDSMVGLMAGAIEKPSLVDGNRVEVALHMYEALYGSAFALLKPRPTLLDTMTVTRGKPGTSEWGMLDSPQQNEINAVYATVGAALEAYMRTIVATPSRFDEYVAGTFDELDEAEKRGLKLFIGKGHCSTCHSGPPDHP